LSRFPERIHSENLLNLPNLRIKILQSVKSEKSVVKKDAFMWDELRFDDRGLIAGVVQDATTGAVLMVAWLNAEALRLTQATGETHFWSRSRGELWHKGATSGNVQRVREIRYDCDGDVLLLLVDPAGPACHTGAVSCFYRTLPVE
jgi:phosphoribosyl-AMP cyclohydrolase